MKFYHVLAVLTIFTLVLNVSTYPLPASNCPISCSCNLLSNVLTISSCTQTQEPFNLPSNFTTNPDLSDVTTIYATNCLIQTFPANICQYPRLSYLDLSSNQIKSFLGLNLNCLTNLTNLYLNNNQLIEIGKTSFNNSKIKSFLVNFSFNKLRKFSSDTFSGQMNLQVLDLSNNELNEIDFPNELPSLNYLFLENNQMSRIFEGLFSNTKMLEFIDLSNNQITEIPAGLFDNLVNLAVLNLTSNRINRVPPYTFNNLAKLWSLGLQNNRISEIEPFAFHNLTKLVNLFLSNNTIREIFDYTFNNSNSVEYIDLSNNQISGISKYAFNNLSHLLHLDLSKNNLPTMELWPTYISSNHFVSINVRYNKIQAFTNTFGWFISNSSSLPTINSKIDLQFNNITEFSDKTIELYGVNSYSDFEIFVKKYFNTFDIRTNQIFCDCDDSNNLINFAKVLFKNSSYIKSTPLYQTTCNQPSKYSGKSILDFDKCSSNSSFVRNNFLFHVFLCLICLFK